MYLKSLEIQGFKSFPDKISLTFDKGLTAVVGPNGSGKSNIGDSVRWVLGEQSTKTLRGNKMEDVIFSGTVARKPMGFAAVTLNIDNSDNVLTDMGDEVAVTRKLYRSGESEYMINGRGCRLKDINELFMDTGLGRDGYSIIGQGRIAEIVGAKSNERRDIFEEAAGISKFRYKKLEAERKLTAAQENLLRLSDIISELESRVEPLRIQSEKAQKFIKLAEERKGLELSVWVTRLDELKVKLDKLDENILYSRGEYENTENDIAREEEKLQESYRRMQECTMKSDELRRKMIEEEQSSSQKKSDIAVFENDISHCREAIQRAKKAMEESEETKKDLTLRKRETEKKIVTLETEKSQLLAEIEKLISDVQTAEEKNNAFGKTVEEINGNINNIRMKQNELRFKAESARRQAIDEEKRLNELLESVTDVESSVNEYNKKIADNKSGLEKISRKKAELANKLSGVERLYSSRKEAFEKAREEVEKSLYELKNCQQRKKILIDLENSMEGFAGSVKQILKASKQGRIGGVYGTVAQNISVEGQYALAVETALGGAMQNIIVENEDSAKRCIRFLKENHGGRGTFLPLTSVKGYELRENGLENCDGFVAMANRIVAYDEKFSGIMASLLGRIAIAEDIDSATVIAKKYGYKFRIVTLDGQVINAGGSFTGGSAQKSAGVITRKNEIDKLDIEINRLTVQREEISGKMEKYRTESEKLRYDREAVRAETAECDSAEIRINAELSSLEVLIEQLRATAENSDRQQAEFHERIEKAKQTETDSLNEAENLEESIKTEEKRLTAEQSSREKLRMERAELTEKLSGLKIREMAVSKDIQSGNEAIIRYESDLSNLSGDNRHFENEIDQNQRTIAEKQKLIATLEAELENTGKNAEDYSAEIQRYQNIHTEQNRLVSEIQKGMKQLNEAKEKLSGEVTRLEERRENANRDTDNIKRQLMDVYEMTYSEAIQIEVKVEDITSAQTQLYSI